MTPEIDYIYECTWSPRATTTFINLVTYVSNSRVNGKCLSNSETFSTYSDTWKKSTSTVTLIGHKDDFPELLV